jgi:drug/metabolite transporter (DMT)-like permease
LTYFVAFFWFLGILIYNQSFKFSLESLPTFGTRVLLEVILTYVSIRAITTSSRSTFSFVRTGTMPLLLLVDIYFGYTISTMQIFGISTIVLAILFLFKNHGLEKRGIGYVVASTLLAAVTISLFKYDISHYNSVAAEQFLTIGFLLVYFYIAAYYYSKKNPLRLLLRPIFFVQSLGDGFAGVLGSFAYSFAPASLVVAVLRSSAILFSMLSGNVYFHEKNLILKILVASLLVFGIVLLGR